MLHKQENQKTQAFLSLSVFSKVVATISELISFKGSFKKGLTACALGSTLMVGSLSLSTDAYAAHGVYNPMMPRQLSEEAATADYSYGYSILPGHALDTLEGPNRAIWFVNYDLLDMYLLRPISLVYAKLPQGVQDSVGNFLSNLTEINNAPNNLIIGEFADSGVSVARFAVNSTIGLLGFFDVASQMGLTYAPMSMDTVLGKAGVEQGAYLQIPGAGFSTMRGIHGDTIDGAPLSSLGWPVTIARFVIGGVHARAQVIDEEGVIDNSIDPYVQSRNVYLMHQEGKVNPVEEGEVKSEDVDDEFLDEIDG